MYLDFLVKITEAPRKLVRVKKKDVTLMSQTNSNT